jgi:hypothetical protein
VDSRVAGDEQLKQRVQSAWRDAQTKTRMKNQKSVKRENRPEWRLVKA